MTTLQQRVITDIILFKLPIIITTTHIIITVKFIITLQSIPTTSTITTTYLLQYYADHHLEIGEGVQYYWKSHHV